MSMESKVSLPLTNIAAPLPAANMVPSLPSIVTTTAAALPLLAPVTHTASSLPIPPAAKAQPRRGGDRRLFAASDDNAMLKQVQATHSPDGRVIDVRPILRVIEDVLRRATPSIDGVTGAYSHQEKIETLEEKADWASYEYGIPESLALIIYKISSELSCKCSGSQDAHGSTMAILNTLSSYPWEAKVVISLAAFAVNYGEFWLVAHLFATHPLAKSVSLLKQLPDMIEHSHLLKPRFDNINNLIKALMDVTECIVEFNELPSKYISRDTPPMLLALAHIPTAVYWTIRSMVACASQIISLLGMSYELITSTTEAWELSSLAHKVHNIHEHLQTQLTHCRHHINNKMNDEYFQMLARLFETIHLDNLKILKHLIYPRDDQLPLVIIEDQIETRVSVEALRRKTVLLIISHLDISIEEITVLRQVVYVDPQLRKELQVEMVWLPVVDRTSVQWNEELQMKFEEKQKNMPWYTLHHPLLLEPAVARYIKEVWRFSKKMIVVALDPMGKVSSPNALDMLWIWGLLAYPFTAAKEDALWKTETWRLELLADGVHADLIPWIAEEKYICIYGGEDIEWIRKFTTAAKQIAKESRIPLEMLYVGKSNTKERVRKNTVIIAKENLSHYLDNPILVWYFWARLESMLFSRMHHVKNIENDSILKEVKNVLSLDASERGWALICWGSSVMAMAKADAFLTCLENYPSWAPNITEMGFVPAINSYLQQTRPPHHCNRLILPGISSGVPELVVCAECSRPMEKYLMYRCCND